MPSPPDAAPFTGFPAKAFTFFKDLGKNNNRDWFQSHKDAFEQSCRDPLKALTVALDPPTGATRITRIHRDVRFSNDKSPYHTHISAVVRGFFLYLSSEGLYIGTGIYMPDPAALRKLREAIAGDAPGQDLVRLVTELRGKGYTVDSHETVASVPRGYDPGHPRIDLLRMKDIHGGRTLDPGQLSSAKAVKAVEKVFADVAPFKQWLTRHVGPVTCG